jgi:hypothetical protein
VTLFANSREGQVGRSSRRSTRERQSWTGVQIDPGRSSACTARPWRVSTARRARR